MTNISVLLTSCVMPPQDMTRLVITNSNERLEQYLEAIKFYINNTNYNIVVVDNSNFDYTKHFCLNDNNYQNRIEFLAFDGSNFDSSRGKGFGEMLIIQHALKKSKFINEKSVIVKVTGRIIVENINDIVNIYLRKGISNNLVFANVKYNLKFLNSVFFIAPFYFYENFFLNKISLVNDKQGVYFEHVLLDSIKEWVLKNNKFFQIPIPTNYKGFSGTSGHKLDDIGTKSKYVLMMKSIYISFMLNIYKIKNKN
jgi:hypothetical protein